MPIIAIKNLMIRISKSCLTGCNYCQAGKIKDEEFYSKDELLNLTLSIEKYLEVTDINYLETITFFGSSILKCPEIFGMFDIIMKKAPNIQIQIDIGNMIPFDINFLISTKDILLKYPLTCLFIQNISDMGIVKNLENWKNFFSFIKNNPTLVKKFLIRYQDSDIYALKILRKIFLFLDLKLEIAFLKSSKVDHKLGLFYPNGNIIESKGCIYLNSISHNTGNSKLYFNDPDSELSLGVDGSIMMHANNCYLSKYRYITNVFKDDVQMISDIDTYMQNLQLVNNGFSSLERTCYTCIFGKN